MISFDYKPQGVCTRNIHLDLSDDGNKVVGVEFTGGCNGNLKALGALAEGMTVEEVIQRLDGIHCGERSTSCSDQLARNLKQVLAEAK